jgi:hypothetical protein
VTATLDETNSRPPWAATPKLHPTPKLNPTVPLSFYKQIIFHDRVCIQYTAHPTSQLHHSEPRLHSQYMGNRCTRSTNRFNHCDRSNRFPFQDFRCNHCIDDVHTVQCLSYAQEGSRKKGRIMLLT